MPLASKSMAQRKSRGPEIGVRRPDLPAFVGGLRLPFLFANFGWPGAKITFHTEGVQLGPSAWIFRPFVPTRKFRFDDCDIQAVGTLWFLTGIRFRSTSIDRWAIFWSFSRERILTVLADMSNRVNTVPEKLNYLRPGPRTAP